MSTKNLKGAIRFSQRFSFDCFFEMQSLAWNFHVKARHQYYLRKQYGCISSSYDQRRAYERIFSVYFQSVDRLAFDRGFRSLVLNFRIGRSMWYPQKH